MILRDSIFKHLLLSTFRFGRNPSTITTRVVNAVASKPNTGHKLQQTILNYIRTGMSCTSQCNSELHVMLQVQERKVSASFLGLDEQGKVNKFGGLSKGLQRYR